MNAKVHLDRLGRHVYAAYRSHFTGSVGAGGRLKHFGPSDHWLAHPSHVIPGVEEPGLQPDLAQGALG
jgi:hypothetical protein